MEKYRTFEIPQRAKNQEDILNRRFLAPQVILTYNARQRALRERQLQRVPEMQRVSESVRSRYARQLETMYPFYPVEDYELSLESTLVREDVVRIFTPSLEALRQITFDEGIQFPSVDELLDRLIIVTGETCRNIYLQETGEFFHNNTLGACKIWGQYGDGPQKGYYSSLKLTSFFSFFAFYRSKRVPDKISLPGKRYLNISRRGKFDNFLGDKTN